jgi:hypothetical protein
MGIIDLGTYVVKIDLKITVDAVILIEKGVLVKVQAISCMGREYSAVAAGFDPKALANSIWHPRKMSPIQTWVSLPATLSIRPDIEFAFSSWIS